MTAKKPASPATRTQHKDMLTLEPHNARQGVGGDGKSVATREEVARVAQHIEKLENMGVCA